MRRVIALGIVALLVSSCGQSDLPAKSATSLQDRVALIREAAEDGRPGIAQSRLVVLVDMVTSQLEDGLIDEGRALAILDAAEAVEMQLALLPAPSPQVSLDPSPAEEDHGGGEGDSGKGKGKGKGGGDEGHGND
jgi:hypothetical protein